MNVQALTTTEGDLVFLGEAEAPQGQEQSSLATRCRGSLIAVSRGERMEHTQPNGQALSDARAVPIEVVRDAGGDAEVVETAIAMMT
ncbi:hypothetical protein SLV14_000233 [Streptomyces sp. Je 1-4]|uniref:hypothetical protein n=1 Tax=Streptomyces TaxID=1883 RepID=UPI0021DAC00C|nr:MULTISPECIES: hypothetical protein [unclassified Streptomyces]UYB37929.1 hypothetical protein SLV14_000233 [Streptomyces sp. Je 1-4]UZQ33857.1 hypothetical protein SLV14N_000233 [Streptomyces sp. Je 1-4] [Streptomyces sp. Je 1-4 4N24]UZQ41275.1 hypothetical protein SLV14NA_000233 [Streptomyces sp. Je 1-4] [Streptomyces sp. Je 1-4 4N24_ara]